MYNKILGKIIKKLNSYNYINGFNKNNEYSRGINQSIFKKFK